MSLRAYPLDDSKRTSLPLSHLTFMIKPLCVPTNRSRGALLLVPLILYLVVCPPSFAYDVPLSAVQIHDAWVLGQRNDQATAEFLAPHIKQTFDTTPDNPHIAEVEVLTPFAQVVDLSRQHPGGYSEQQAERDYHARGDTVLVRVRLMLPSAYPKQESGPASPSAPTQQQKKALRPENFWQNFQFSVTQRGKTLPPRSVQSKPIYSAPSKDTLSVLDGATVRLEFDAKNVSSEPLTVEIVTPDSKTIPATFDLQKLR
jgi:hypothetical protein